MMSNMSSISSRSSIIEVGNRPLSFLRFLAFIVECTAGTLVVLASDVLFHRPICFHGNESNRNAYNDSDYNILYKHLFAVFNQFFLLFQ